MPSKKPTTIDGQTFASLKEAVEHFGKNYQKISTRLNLKWTLEEAFDIKPAPNSIQVNGVVFNSILALCSHYQINEKTFHTRIERGWNVEEALELRAPPRNKRAAYNAYISNLGLRVCSKCKQEKSTDDFYLRKNKQNIYGSSCKSCITISVRESLYRRKYNMSSTDWHEMFDNQNHSCKICRKQTTKGSWAIDHCHQTGGVRGILCMSCNTGLGFFGDQKEILMAAIKYLEAYEKASNNTVRDGMIIDNSGHHLCEYSDEMAQEYLKNCNEDFIDLEEVS